MDDKVYFEVFFFHVVVLPVLIARLDISQPRASSGITAGLGVL